MFADDLAEACVFLMNNYDSPDLVNIGTGNELSIGELAEMVREIVGFKGKIVFDTSRADGTPRKLLDVTKLHNLGYHHKVNLREGIGFVYQNFLEKETVLPGKN